MKKILFVCKNNMVRSPIAKFLFKRILKENDIKYIKVDSAGISKEFNGVRLKKTTIVAQSLKKFGIDTIEHVGKILSLNLIKSSDLILTFEKNQKNVILDICPSAKSKIFVLKEFLGYKKNVDIKDMETKPLQYHIKFIKNMERYCRKLLKSKHFKNKFCNKYL